MIDQPVHAGPGLTLRRLDESDVPAAHRILSAAFSQETGAEVAARLRYHCKSGQADLTLDEQSRESTPTEYWVLTEGPNVIGLCGLYRFAWAWRRSFWLAWTAIDPSRHGQGIGTAMLTTLMRIARAKGAEVFKVETLHGGSATAFYRKLGFVEEGVLTRHYSEDMDAVVLSRNLADVEPLEDVGE